MEGRGNRLGSLVTLSRPGLDEIGSKEGTRMIRRLLGVIASLLCAALTLASVFLLLHMTVQSELMENPLPRNLAMLGTLIAGVLLLMGSVYISTRIAVLLFSGKEHAENPGKTSERP
jgi:hypothetical protein